MQCFIFWDKILLRSLSWSVTHCVTFLPPPWSTACTRLGTWRRNKAYLVEVKFPRCQRVRCFERHSKFFVKSTFCCALLLSPWKTVHNLCHCYYHSDSEYSLKPSSTTPQLPPHSFPFNALEWSLIGCCRLLFTSKN